MSDTAARIFRRELIGALLFYFPVTIITANIFMAAGIKIRPPFDLVVLLLPAIVLVAIAYLRTKYYHGVDYRPNTKNLSALIAIASLMFLLERVVYSFIHPDIPGIVLFSALFLVVLVWNRTSKDELNPIDLAKMLITVSTFFIFIWLVFALITRSLYGFIVLTSWIFLFSLSLYVLKRKGGG